MVEFILDPEDESRRLELCADGIYTYAYKNRLTEYTPKAIMEWCDGLHDIMMEYRITALYGFLDCFDEPVVSEEAFKRTRDDFLRGVRSYMDDRKLNAAKKAAEFGLIVKGMKKPLQRGPFRVEYAANIQESVIFLDGTIIEYDRDRMGKKDNYQWKPLLISLLETPSLKLAFDVAKYRASTTNPVSCVAKLTQILKLHHQKYPGTPRVTLHADSKNQLIKMEITD